MFYQTTGGRMRNQKTLAHPTSLSGIGLHSGQPATLTLHPAPADTGVVFYQKTTNAVHSCPAYIKHLRPMELCTTIGLNGFQIQTVEHVLSALAGLEIDNAYLELDGNEVPAVDGSAGPFVNLIQSVGAVEQDLPRTYLKIVRPLSVGNDSRSLTVYPSALPKISYSIDYPHPLIQQQSYVHDCSVKEFQKNIAGARTFAFRQEVELLWSKGLGIGGSLDNTLVLSETGLMNESGFRFHDECVRHKVLDLIGDISLLGVPVIGHFVAHRAGHSVHAQMVKAILESPDAWILLNTSDEERSTMVHTASPFPKPMSEIPQPAYL
jgi:UDP-3-O-[3-hydroxymyristoyl] N-acetylglucosamine deacetylase